tara:strand:- start:682 stop:975 length:294 start_codon:yes stop_codon:yes gene_type:complete
MNHEVLYNAYVKGNSMMTSPGLFEIKEELQELIEDKSVEEIFDVIHTICRVTRAPNIVTYILAHPTAKKHALRVLSYGCPRSRRNCKKAGASCICKK